jgi:hypothetical protein
LRCSGVDLLVIEGAEFGAEDGSDFGVADFHDIVFDRWELELLEQYPETLEGGLEQFDVD